MKEYVIMPDKTNRSTRQKEIIVYIVLTILTLAVYWQVNQFDFVNIDDPVYITENNNLKSGFTPKGLGWAFGIRSSEFWHPLTWLSFMLDYRIYGLNAGGYHLTNLILHLMSALLLFWLFNRMTAEIWKSAFVAALFALHPLHVESVAWVTERKDVLSAFFWMLTLCAYVYYTEHPGIKRYWVVLIFFVLALMSKSTVVTLPVIMILLDYWPLKRFRTQTGNFIRWQIKEKFIFFLMAAFISIITILAQNKMSLQYPGYPLTSRIENALVSFIAYPVKIFWPRDLTFFYPLIHHYPFWQTLAAAMMIIVISISVIVTARRVPCLFAGWFWYAITIAPVTGIIHFSSQAMADRYTYLPSIGISIMMAWGVPLLFRSEKLRKRILFPAGAVFLAVMAFLTWTQCGYWKNSVALLRHALDVRQDVYIVHDCLGLALSAEGKNNEALKYFEQAILLKPDYANAYFNRGNVYLETGQHQNAVKDFNEAIRLRTDYGPAYYKRAIAYSKTGDYRSAIKDYNEVIRLNPDYADAYNNRGAVYLNLGDKESGCRDAQKACDLGTCKLLEIAGRQGDCP